MKKPRTTLGIALVKAGLVQLPPPPPRTAPLVTRRPGTALPRPLVPPAPQLREYFREELPEPPTAPPFDPAPRHRAQDIKSATTQPREQVGPPRTDGPAKYTGEMVWLHKTAPVLEIHGRPRLTPEDYAAGRRR